MALAISACYAFALSTNHGTQQSIFSCRNMYFCHISRYSCIGLLWGEMLGPLTVPFHASDDWICGVTIPIPFGSAISLTKLAPADIHVDCGTVQHLMWAAVFPVGYRRNWQLPSQWTSKHVWNSDQSQICHHICLWGPVHQLSLHPSGWQQGLKQLCWHL